MKGSNFGCEELVGAAAAAGKAAGVEVLEGGWLCLLAEGKGDRALVLPNGCSVSPYIFAENTLFSDCGCDLVDGYKSCVNCVLELRCFCLTSIHTVTAQHGGRCYSKEAGQWVSGGNDDGGFPGVQL